MLKRLLLTLCLLLAGASASAADDSAGLWVTGTLAKALSKDWQATLALQSRFIDGVDSNERVLIRPALTYKANAMTALTVGYDAHLIDAPRNQTEHRAWQQIAVSTLLGTTHTHGWFRLEERVIERVDGAALRARFLIGADWASGFELLPRFVLRNEVFVNLNSPDRGPQSGYDQNRFFTGFSRPLSAASSVEVGYQMQHIHRTARRNLAIHQGMLSFNARF